MPGLLQRVHVSLPAALRDIDISDQRAADAANELVDALWRQSVAAARLRAAETGTPAQAAAREEVDELEDLIRDLARTLRERPWTEG